MNKFVTVPMVVTAIAAAAMAAGTMLILSVSATHADGYYRKPVYAPAYEPAPQCCDYANFRGLYIGAHVGYVGSATTATLRDGEAVGEVQQSVTSNAASGGLYGLHLGYNFQRDRFVIGLEGDFTGTITCRR